MQVYVSKADATQRLIIAQSAAGARVPGPGPNGWTSIRIRGHPGLATRNLITWRESGLTDYIVVGSQDGLAEPQALTTQQLIAIADGASAYDSATWFPPAPGSPPLPMREPLARQKRRRVTVTSEIEF